MALVLDDKIDKEIVKQFASQLEQLPQETRLWFEETFDGRHSIEFYEGLLSAYATMYQIIQGVSPEQTKQYSGQIVAFVADKLQKKYDK